jgi:uncharacterized protein YggE
MKRIARILLAILPLILPSRPLLAQAVGNSIYNSSTTFNNREGNWPYTNDSTMVVMVSTLMNVRASEYVAILGVAQVAPTIDSANVMINSRIDDFANGLSRMGLRKSDLYIDLISQVPVYEYEVENKLFSRTYNEVPRGFDLKKNVHISYSRPDQLDDILLEAAKHEIYDIVKVDYVINNMESIYDSLRSVATRLMGKKIRDFEKLGVKLVPMYQTIAENRTSVYPSERYSAYSAFNSTSLREVKKPLIGSASVNVAEKPVTLYYNRLPYHDYDIVINPQIVEPAVQFSYKLMMKYVMKKQ